MTSAVLKWLWAEFQWPQWASAVCVALAMCLLVLHLSGKLLYRSRDEKAIQPVRHSKNSDDKDLDFSRFRRQYLAVYFLVMFADWLQGTHMYSLYESYNVNISVLFLTGFLSSALFGGVVGPIVDRYGRKKACLVFCVLEIVINLLEAVPDTSVLLIGRVLGGITTSLLFSAFESWLVTEHRSRGYSDVQITKTFALAAEGNGLLAVLAGIVAQVSADAFGEIGPFRVAVLVTVLALLCILPWTENYGSERLETSAAEKKASSQKIGWTDTASSFSTCVYALGLCYSLFEGGMYIFVFLWYPTLYDVVPDSNLPSGLVFSSFMLSIAIGGKLYDIMGTRVGEERLAVFLCGVASVLFVIPAITKQFEWILASFLLFELCVGAFTPCCATLRSRYFPNDQLSTVLSWFRTPTNVLVVLGTGGVNYFQTEQLFQFCSAVMLIAAASGIYLGRSHGGRDGKQKNA